MSVATMKKGSHAKKTKTQAAPSKIVRLQTKSSRNRNLSRKDREFLVVEFRLKARKLARSILRKWHARLDLQEVDSVVDLSLCEAVKRYNPNKGASFMTFLFYHLRGNLIRAVAAAAASSSVPFLDPEALEPESDTARGSLASRRASAAEVAEALNGNESMLPDEVLFKKELLNISSEACARLDSLEREVIYRIYLQEQQLMDIAASLGYSRCHISRVKRKALETLYQEMSSASPEESKNLGPERDSVVSIERRTIHRRRPRSRKQEVTAEGFEAPRRAVGAA